MWSDNYKGNKQTSHNYLTEHRYTSATLSAQGENRINEMLPRQMKPFAFLQASVRFIEFS